MCEHDSLNARVLAFSDAWFLFIHGVLGLLLFYPILTLFYEAIGAGEGGLPAQSWWGIILAVIMAVLVGTLVGVTVLAVRMPPRAYFGLAVVFLLTFVTNYFVETIYLAIRMMQSIGFMWVLLVGFVLISGTVVLICWVRGFRQPSIPLRLLLGFWLFVMVPALMSILLTTGSYLGGRFGLHFGPVVGLWTSFIIVTWVVSNIRGSQIGTQAIRIPPSLPRTLTIFAIPALITEVSLCLAWLTVGPSIVAKGSSWVGPGVSYGPVTFQDNEVTLTFGNGARRLRMPGRIILHAVRTGTSSNV